MLIADEISFDIYISINIYFKADNQEKDELVLAHVNKIRSIFYCFDVPLHENSISLLNGNNFDKVFPQFNPYELSALLSIDDITYQGLQVIERALTNITQYWNHRHSGRDMDYAFFEIKTYQNGKRP